MFAFYLLVTQSITAIYFIYRYNINLTQIQEYILGIFLSAIIVFIIVPVLKFYVKE